MTNANLVKRLKQVSAFTAAVSACVSALVSVASAAQHYTHVAFMPEAICGSDHDVLESLKSNEKQLAVSPAQLVDQHFWERSEVAEHHKGVLFSEIRKTDPTAYRAYLPVWWQEARRVESCLGKFEAAYEQSPGYLKLVYPPRTQQQFRIAREVVVFIQMQNEM